MEYVGLGNSGLKVSKFILGTLTFAGTNGFEALGAINVDQARRLIDMAADAGVNAIDTANLYSMGDAEQVVGEAIAGKRDDFLLFSKGGSRFGDGENDEGASRANLTRQLEASLRRLRTDYLDLYWIHHWDGLTPVEETVSTMSDFVKTGKIRYWGVSNYSGWSVAKTAMAARDAGLAAPVAHQLYYTPEAREAEYELIPAGVDLGISSVVWSPLGQGLFGGKVGPDGSAPGDIRQGHADWKEPFVCDWDRFAATLGAVRTVAAETGHSVAQVTLAWLRDRPGIGAIVLGARNAAQLSDDLAAFDVSLSAEQSARIEEAGRPAPLYPFWHRSQRAFDRASPIERIFLERFRETADK